MKPLPDYIDLVRRPSRYIGHEIGSVRKPENEVDTRVALVFPDVYEIGISNLGLRILYHVLNRTKGVQAERVYSPWVDLEEVLVNKKLPLLSIENNKPLREFDIIGITLQYEMSYTNILNILKLSFIPIKSGERDEDMPLVIAGGPCAFNPEPLAQFFDAFVIGDGEEVFLEIVEVYRGWRNFSSKKLELLKALSEIEGVYVPYFFKVSHHSDGRISDIKNVNVAGKDSVYKRTVKSLVKEDFPCRTIIPYIEAVHDRVNIEIARGCLNGCRFCQAGIIYRPLRERDPDEIKELIKLSIRNSGYNEVSLTSLNAGDYSGIGDLVPELMDYFEPNRISLSLPSLRPDTLRQTLASQIKRFRKTGFTIAPEAGSQSLRNVINKQISEDEILKAAETVFKEGWGALKLYFMIGLPTEKTEDIKEMISLIKKIKKLAAKSTGKFKRISVSISPFVPKSHTPFQWVSQEGLERLNDKIRWINENIRDQKIDIEWHDPRLSFLEAVLARGDRKLGGVLEKALDSGCKFDGWREHFDFQKWMKAFDETGIDPYFYSTRARELDEVFPWEHIKPGVSMDFLRNEYSRALQGIITPDCRKSGCTNCGLADKGCDYKTEKSYVAQSISSEKEEIRVESEDLSVKFRIKFQKTEIAKYLSHLEFQNVLIRALSRARIPVAYSRGFHPHPLLSFSVPLSVGFEGFEEYLDIQLEKEIGTEDFCSRVNKELPLGIRFLDARKLLPGSRSLMKVISSFEYEISAPHDIFSENGNKEKWAVIGDLMKVKSDSLSVEEPLVLSQTLQEAKVADYVKFIKKINIEEEGNKLVKIKYETKLIDGKMVKPKDIMKEIFDIDSNVYDKIKIKRTRVILDQE